MRAIILRIIAILAGLALAAPAVGQSTQPAGRDAWSATVSAFAQALADGDAATILPLLAENVSVAAFDAKSADAVRLLARVRGGMLVMARAYPQAPAALAGDVAGAMATAAVSDEMKLKMMPQGEAAMIRANQVAGQWVREALGVKAQEPVGAMVFCCASSAGAAAAGGAQSTPEVVFVLVKAATGDGTRCSIQGIVFGDPRRQVK